MRRIATIVLSHFTITCLFFSPSHAGENYYIGRDEGGIYFQTEKDGGWYIDAQDLKYFKVGESGVYRKGVDHKGPYILTEKKKFYLDSGRKESLEKDIVAFNEQQKAMNNNSETAVSIDGNRVLVPVIIKYSGKTSSAKLLLDTGASIVTLHRNIANKLKIKNTRNTKLKLAGGQLIPADIARIDDVIVGPNRKSNLFVSIIDQIDTNADYDGLLGMNFLRNLRYEIDFNKSIIKWY
jgi:predicted aspartyl protease